MEQVKRTKKSKLALMIVLEFKLDTSDLVHESLLRVCEIGPLCVCVHVGVFVG